jgi:hypothetical protein
MATIIARVALGMILPTTLSATLPAHPMAVANQATLEVTNNNAQPVFLVLIDRQADGWAQWPLGTVEENASQVFHVDPDVLERPNIRIVASAFSNWKEYTSKGLTFTRGRHLDLTLNNPEPYSLLAKK